MARQPQQMTRAQLELSRTPAALQRDREQGIPARPSQTLSPMEQGDVSTTHPDFEEFRLEYSIMRNTIRGATAVKQAGEEYLPMPSGFRGQTDGGFEMYAAYVTRAQFPELTGPTVIGMLGTIHRREATIEIPDSLEHLWEDADGKGTPLEALHQRVTEELLTVGRTALLGDAPAEGGDPKIKIYVAEDLRNWSEDEDFYVLYEGGLQREGFRWVAQDKWRVLSLLDGVYIQTLYTRDAFVGDPIIPTQGRTRNTLNWIPLVVANSLRVAVKPEAPPLIGVARAALAIFRLDADLRHQLFMSGQETLFITGLDADDAPKVIGASVVITLPKDGSANYVGPSGTGIEAHERAIENERRNAISLGARVLDSEQKGGVESGEALRIRRGAATATLVSIANSSAKALEGALRNIGRMQGLTDSEIDIIVVKPDLSFVDNSLTPQEAVALVGIWQQGAISYETLYWNLQRGEIATTERTADEEQELIEEETPDPALGALDVQTAGEPEEDVVDPDETPPISDEELADMFAPELLEE